MNIKKMNGANAYLNGENLLGKIEEIDLGSLKPKMEDYKSLGLLGDFEIPVGFEKTTASITFKSFDKKVWSAIANLNVAQTLIIKGNQSEWSHIGKFSNEPITIVLNGIFKSVPLGQFAQHEVKNLKVEMAVWKIAMEIDKVPVMAVDYLTNTYKVGAISLFENQNKNI
jgi:P2 family phage contractile tail tube protein